MGRGGAWSRWVGEGLGPDGWRMGGFAAFTSALTNSCMVAMVIPHSTYHWGHTCAVDQWDGEHGVYPNATQPKVNFSDELHVFAIEWNTTAISWFMDNHLYYTRTAGKPPTLFIPNRPFHVILNTALDWWSPPDDSTPFPGYHMIDYVTIYQAK